VKFVLQEHPQLVIAIRDDISSTVIQLKGPASGSRMSDLGPMFDKLGESLSACPFCSELPWVWSKQHDQNSKHLCLVLVCHYHL
jgi:hypothetical protein